VIYVCDPSYTRDNHSLRPALGKSARPYLKKKIITKAKKELGA
jgi:hypothetical protein